MQSDFITLYLLQLETYLDRGYHIIMHISRTFITICSQSWIIYVNFETQTIKRMNRHSVEETSHTLHVKDISYERLSHNPFHSSILRYYIGYHILHSMDYCVVRTQTSL